MNVRTKKVFSYRRSGLIAVAAVGALALSACSGGSKPADSTDAGSGGEESSSCEGTITVASWAAAADALEEAAGLYDEQNDSDVKIEIQRVGHDYANIIPALTSGSGAPDIMHVEQRDFQTFQRQFEGQFADLTEFLEPYEGEFAEIAWTAAGDGTAMHGVPWDLGPAGVWYRTDLYEEAGLNPEDIKTWDDFIEAGQTLQEKLDDVNMVAFDTTGSDPNPSTWMLLMAQDGGTYTTDGKIDFANVPNVEAMQQVRDFKDAGIVYDAGDWTALVEAVSSSRTASVILPVWFAGTIEAQAPDQEGLWSVMPLPAFEDGGNTDTNLGGGVLAVSENSECKAEALDFIKFALLTDEGQTVQLAHGLFPSWQPFYESPAFAEADTGFFAVNIPETFAALALSIPNIEFGPYYMDFHSELSNAYGSVMSGGTAPLEALQEAEDRAASATGLEVVDN